MCLDFGILRFNQTDTTDKVGHVVFALTLCIKGVLQEVFSASAICMTKNGDAGETY